MKLKKLAAVLSAAAVAVSAFVLPVGAETGMVDGEVDTATGLVYSKYNLEGGKSGWKVSCTQDTAKVFNGEVVIPTEWGEGDNKKTVIVLSDALFSMGDKIKSISIPASVEMIDSDYGFIDSTLEEIKVAEDSQYLCAVDGVLYNKAKTELIRYPAYKSGESFTIPATVNSIDIFSFAGAKNLTSMTIPDSVTSIDLDMFAFSAIKSMSLPATLTEFVRGFRMYQLKSISIDERNEKFCSEDGILFNKDKTELIAFPNSKLADTYDIPNTVKKLGDYALFNYNIKEVNIPTSVTEIGGYVFWDAPSNRIKINYAGTIEQWNAIIKNGENYRKIEENGVTCSDGVIEGTAVDTGTAAQEATKETDEEGKTTFTPAVESTNHYTEYQMEDVKDVRVEAPADAFDSDVNMQIAPESITGNTFSVDIKFVDSTSGAKVQPKIPVTVKIPLPASLSNARNLNLYHTDDNGTITKVDFTIDTIGGKQYVVFTATSFSVYEITTEEKILNLSDSSNDPSSVPTYGPFEHNKYTGESNRVTVSIDSTPANTTTEAAPADTTAAANTTATEASNNGGDRDTNQPTGAAIAVVPAILAIAGVVLSKKRK